MKNLNAFTLMELTLTITIVCFIAVSAISKFDKVLRTAEQRDILMQLRLVHGAATIYKAKNGSYWSPGFTTDVDLINSNLGINIIPKPGFDYEYEGFDVPLLTDWSLEVEALGGMDWELRVTSLPLSATNPCCDPEDDPPEMCLVNRCP